MQCGLWGPCAFLASLYTLDTRFHHTYGVGTNVYCTPMHTKWALAIVVLHQQTWHLGCVTRARYFLTSAHVMLLNLARVPRVPHPNALNTIPISTTSCYCLSLHISGCLCLYVQYSYRRQYTKKQEYDFFIISLHHTYVYITSFK